MPAADPRNAEINQMITEVYSEQGPEPIMTRFGLSKSAVYSRAYKLGILASAWRRGSGTVDPLRQEIDTMIREVYPTQGYKPIAEKFGLTRNTVQIHAKLLGVYRDFTAETTRNQEILEMIREVYPTQGVGPVCERYGLTAIAVGLRARRAGIHQDTEALYDRISETKARLFDTLDLSLWTPELTRIGAYYLGLAWADANTAFVRPGEATARQSRYFVRFCQSGEGDREVVDYLAKVLGLSPERVRPVKKYKDSHLVPYGLKLSGKRIASLFIDHFKIPMRKSYIDPPYPNIPDEFLAAFTCGQFDGDGCNALFLKNSPNPYYFFFGSHSFMEIFHQKLEEQVGVQFRPLRPHSKNESLWVFGVYDVRQTVPLTRFLYNGYYQEEGVPYFKRKHEVFEHFLTPGYFTIRGGYQRWL